MPKRIGPGSPPLRRRGRPSSPPRAGRGSRARLTLPASLLLPPAAWSPAASAPWPSRRIACRS